MKIRILVTGGAGYIGSVLVPELLSAGYQVTVADNFMYQQASLNHCASNPDFSVVRTDVRVKETMLALLQKVDVVIPLAALVGAPACARDPVGAASINHDAMLMLFGILSKEQRVIMPTTNSAYGSGDENNYCDEESPLNPLSQYAVEKLKVEQELMKLPNAISLRLATVFGMSPRMRTDLLVNDFTYRAVYDRFIVLFESHFKRNYIHIRDIAHAFLHVLDNYDTMNGEIYNVGLSNANISKMELCEQIKKHIPQFVFLEEELSKDPDQRNYTVSNAKIEATGFMPQYSLEDGIVELIKGYTMLCNNRYTNV